MLQATVTSRGRITIPQAIRKRLRLRAGDVLGFLDRGDGTVTIRKRARRIEDVFGAFAHHANRTISVQEMDETIAASSLIGALHSKIAVKGNILSTDRFRDVDA